MQVLPAAFHYHQREDKTEEGKQTRQRERRGVERMSLSHPSLDGLGDRQLYEGDHNYVKSYSRSSLQDLYPHYM